MFDIHDKDEAIEKVLAGINWLILHHSNSVTNRSTRPTHDVDEDDDVIRDNKECVRVLRKMRNEFEAYSTGYAPVEQEKKP